MKGLCSRPWGDDKTNLDVVSGKWITPPEAARLCAEADKVLTFYGTSPLLYRSPRARNLLVGGGYTARLRPLGCDDVGPAVARFCDEFHWRTHRSRRAVTGPGLDQAGEHATVRAHGEGSRHDHHVVTVGEVAT